MTGAVSSSLLLPANPGKKEGQQLPGKEPAAADPWQVSTQLYYSTKTGPAIACQADPAPIAHAFLIMVRFAQVSNYHNYHNYQHKYLLDVHQDYSIIPMRYSTHNFR